MGHPYAGSGSHEPHGGTAGGQPTGGQGAGNQAGGGVTRVEHNVLNLMKSFKVDPIHFYIKRNLTFYVNHICVSVSQTNEAL